MQIIFKPIYLTERWGTTTPGYGGSGSDSNERVHHTFPVLQKWNLTIRFNLESYPEYYFFSFLGESYTYLYMEYSQNIF